MSRLFYDRPIDVYHARTARATFSLRAANGRDPAQLTEDQGVLFKIGVAGADEPLLDLTEEPNDQGSVITIISRGDPDSTPPLAAVLRLTVGEDDLDPETIAAGEYEGELILVDEAAAQPPNALRSLGRGRIVVHPSMG